ncbi:MAG: hypothetical protein ACRET5_17985, partial [Steroidobacteraceae bacterium]
MLRPRLLPVLTAAVVLGAAAATTAQSASSRSAAAVEYHRGLSVPLGAPDRWDYVVYDGPSHRVYVAHGD